MTPFLSYEEYRDSLTRISGVADPTLDTADSLEIKAIANDLAALGHIDRAALITWVAENPDHAYVLGLVLGLSQERLKSTTRDLFGTESIRRQAKVAPAALVERLDEEFDLVAVLVRQLAASYGFGDVLVARAGSRVRARAAADLGRTLENEVEKVVKDLGLPYELRTRFVGRMDRTGPCDLVIASKENADIIVAAKGFDSTGSKQTAAADEITLVADVRMPHQFVCVVMDGMAWKRRQGDLRRIYELWESKRIDGLYSRRTLGRFRDDIARQARLRGYLV